MIKKWSYVAAAMLTVASGVALTSCIDNDEPYGIEQIRLATASLLESKKAAVEAEAAAKSAEVEIAKIWAEVEQMRVQKDKILAEAEAKVKEAEAQAKLLESQAAAAKTQAEADSLKAEAEKLLAEARYTQAQTDAYIADKKAKLDEYMAKAEIWVKESQLAYDQALYAFEKEKLYNAEQYASPYYDAWEAAFEAYLTQLDYVNTLTSVYYAAAAEYAKAEVDLVPVEKDGTIIGWVSKNYDGLAILKQNVVDAQKAIDEANEEITKKQEIVDDLTNLNQTSDLYKAYEKYEEAAKTNKAAYAEAKAELEAVKVENKALWDEVLDLRAQVKDFDSQKIEIPAYTWDPETINDGKDKAAFASIGITESVEIVPERTYYTLGDDFDETDETASTYSNYTKAVSAYESQINELKNYLLDANDVAWTNATINELKRRLATEQDAYGKAQKNWETAKLVYSDGGEPKYDKVPGETEVVKAMNAYNATASTYKDLKTAYLNAQKADNEADQVVIDALSDATIGSAASTFNAALNTFNRALERNKQTYLNDIEANQKAYNKFVADALNEYDDAKRDEQAKLDIYNATLKANNNKQDAPDVVTAKGDYDAAKTVTANKKTAYENAPKTAAATQTQDNLTAEVNWINADKSAEETYEQARTDFENAVGSEISADFQAALDEAKRTQKELDDARDALMEDATVEEKFEELYDLCLEQEDVVGVWNLIPLSEVKAKLSAYLADPNKEFPEVKETPAHYAAGEYDVTVGSTTQKVYFESNVMQYLINTSQVAYGKLGDDYDKQNPKKRPWDVDHAFLIDAKDITPAMINAYIKEKYPKLSEFKYYTHYDLFGLYGQTLYTTNRIDVATAMVNNQKLLSESLKPLQDGLEALEDGKEAAEEEYEKLDYALADKEQEFKNLQKTLQDKANRLKKWNTIYSKLLSELTTLIAEVEENIGTEDDPFEERGDLKKYIKDTIEKYNKEIKEEKEKLEEGGELYNWLDYANYQLKQYQDNEGVMTANPEQTNLDMAILVLNTAKDKLDMLKAHADELEALYKDAQARYKEATSNK